MTCLDRQTEKARQRRSVARDEEFQANKAKLKEHDYQWKRQRRGFQPDAEFVWVLLDPQGIEVSKEEALRRIAEIESPGPECFKYF